MSRDLYAVILEITTFGPISIYTPYSTTSANTYFLPPPTTLVGALAYAYKRSLNDFKEIVDEGVSPAVKLIENKEVLYASAGIDKPYTFTKSVERVYQHIYLRPEHWKKLDMAYTVGVRAAIIVDKLYAFYITSNKDIARYGYGVTRIGRKESLVSVDNVCITPLRDAVSRGRVCETGFYFPLSIAKDYGEKDIWIEIDMPTLSRDNFLKRSLITEKYVLPKPFVFRKTVVELNDAGIAIQIKCGGKEMEIPIPRRVVEV